jgi:hypothetical protein
MTGTARRIVMAVVIAIGAATPGYVKTICPPCPKVSHRWDFNGDFYKDLVVGVPFEDVEASWDSGAAQVLYGGPDGITAANNQLFSAKTSPAVGNGSAGSGLASGDFNQDGYGDLVIGAPGASFAALGRVDILYGSSGGLTGWKHQVFNRASLSDRGWPSALEGDFGAAVAAGDFNDDGFDDLAIGDPIGEYVVVLYGASSGLTTVGKQLWMQNTLGVPGQMGEHRFGTTLLAVNFGRGSAEDLAIGAPKDLESGAGSVLILYGTTYGLTARGNQLFTQGPDLGDTPEWGDYFGFALASGDFNGDTFTDLAIAAPFERFPAPCLDGEPVCPDGMVHVVYGSAGGLSPKSTTHFSAFTLGLPLEGRLLGRSLVSGNFGADGCPSCDDLAMGAPGEGPGVAYGHGAVYLLYGSTSGLVGLYERWDQSGAVPGVPGEHEGFGASLAAHNFGNGGHDDLAVGVPWDDASGVDFAGAVNVLYGRSTGLSTIGAQLWSQGTPGIKGSPEYGDFFGTTLGQ